MHVLRDDADGVTTLTLNRPDKLNAIHPELMLELRGHVDALAKDEAVGCVILTGAGRSFCAGHDLTAITTNDVAPENLEPETDRRNRESAPTDDREDPRPLLHRRARAGTPVATSSSPRTRRGSATPMASGVSHRCGACRSGCPSGSADRAPRN